MERRDASINPERGWEIQVIFDDVVKREIESHPELTSRRKKLIFMQETFQFWNPVELGHIIGVDERTIRRFLSRRGIRNNEFEEVERRFNGAFAVTSIIEHHIQGLLPRRDVFVKPNALLENKGVKEMLKRGEVEKAVSVADRTYWHIRG